MLTIVLLCFSGLGVAASSTVSATQASVAVRGRRAMNGVGGTTWANLLTIPF